MSVVSGVVTLGGNVTNNYYYDQQSPLNPRFVQDVGEVGMVDHFIENKKENKSNVLGVSGGILVKRRAVIPNSKYGGLYVNSDDAVAIQEAFPDDLCITRKRFKNVHADEDD